MVYIMHQKCKVPVIVWHGHNIMMIPITRNHQEGEEHAIRSIVSSSVRWSIEGIVLKKLQVYMFIGAHYQPSMQHYVRNVDAPRTTTMVQTH